MNAGGITLASLAISRKKNASLCGTWRPSMDPGWSPVFNHDHHQTILTILKALNRPLLEETSAYFGGGTLLALKFNGSIHETKAAV